MRKDGRNWIDVLNDRDGPGFATNFMPLPEERAEIPTSLLRASEEQENFDRLFPYLPDVIEWTFPNLDIETPEKIVVQSMATTGFRVYVDYEPLDDLDRRFRCDFFTLPALRNYIIDFNEGAVRDEWTGHIENGRSFYSEEGKSLEKLKETSIERLRSIVDLVKEHGQARSLSFEKPLLR